MEPGIYHLVETHAPDGYNLNEGPVVVTVTPAGVYYDESTMLSSDGRGLEESDGVYVLLVSNSSGFELPKTGGASLPDLFRIGAGLLALGCALLARRRWVW